MKNPIRVDPLASQQAPQAVETLVEAFADDPSSLFFFPAARGRAACMAEVFRRMLRYGRVYGIVETAPADAGVAIWIKPETLWPTWWRMAWAGMFWLPLRIGFRAARRLMLFSHQIESERRQTLSKPHWYLLALGVRPDFQGHGVGGALLRAGLDRATKTTLPCYLETANSKNLDFYRKHGFQLLKTRKDHPQAPTTWSMVTGVKSVTA